MTYFDQVMEAAESLRGRIGGALGGETARILIVFNSGHYQTIDLSQWIAGNPTDILATNFSVDASVFETFPRRYVFLTK